MVRQEAARRPDLGQSERPGGMAPVPPVVVAALLCALMMAGCRPLPTRLTIRGGPSLDGLFADLAAAYQKQHPKVTVVTNFTCPPCVVLTPRGSDADFDIFASLGQFEMDRLCQLGHLRFASSTEVGRIALALVTSTHAKVEVRSLADLHKKSVRRIGVGDPKQVGVGYYAHKALTRAGLWEELEPRFVYSQSGCELLKWLGLGRDIDAAIVFAVCVGDEPGSVRSVTEFPPDLIPPVPLLLGVTSQAPQPEEARRFITFLRSPDGREILARHKVQPVKDP